MEIEVYRDIEGYEGLYQVSNLGNVKSLNYGRTGKEKLLKLYKGNNGYLYITLYKNKKQKLSLVHRLVALTFIPNPNNLKEINHKDENPLNNMVENLEWCDRKYNNTYGNRIKKSIQTSIENNSYNKGIEIRRINNSLREKPIIQYTKNMIEVCRFKSTKEAERKTGIPHSNICYCLKGKRNIAGGYIWKYAI